MNRLLLIPLALLLAAPSTLLAEEKGHATDEAHEHEPLEAQMEIIGKAYKTIRKGVKDPQKAAEVVAAIDTMIAAVTEAKQHAPEMIAELPADKQAEAKADYVAKMEALATDLASLKTALAAGDADKVAELVKALGGHKKDGHKQFDP